MNIRQLEAFCKVMETGSMSEAARSLGVSQPAISKSIRLLEQALRLTLFKRSGDRLYPSMEAQRLYPGAHKIFEELENTVELSRKLHAAEVGTLKIAATYAVTAAYIPESIAAFHHHRPLADIQFMALPPRQIIELVASRELDAGFLYEPIADPNVRQIPLCDVDIVCALPTQHHLNSKDIITGHDLARETLISFSEDAYAGGVLAQQCRAAGMPWKVSIAVNQTVVAMRMVAEGIGVAVIDSLGLNADAPQISVKPFQPRTVLHVSAIVPSHRPLSRLGEEFINSLTTVVARRAEQSQGFHKVANPG